MPVDGNSYPRSHFILEVLNFAIFYIYIFFYFLLFVVVHQHARTK